MIDMSNESYLRDKWQLAKSTAYAIAEIQVVIHMGAYR